MLIVYKLHAVHLHALQQGCSGHHKDDVFDSAISEQPAAQPIGHMTTCSTYVCVTARAT